MKKFRLQLEDLQIDSFATTPVRKDKGTVFGEQCTCPTACTCPGCPTCDASCGGTCDATCNGTCDATCGCPSNDCTFEISCGGQSCDYTCGGFMTYGPKGQMCVECAW